MQFIYVVQFCLQIFLYIYIVSEQSSIGIFTQKYLHKCENTYFILQNNYHCIFENSFGAKIVRQMIAPQVYKFAKRKKKTIYKKCQDRVIMFIIMKFYQQLV